ncbi:hypothetical protein [Allopusillimonas ginsengisoli]|uniref:hypothetical protein n=1 Tax=Allopusillimonas ginsengisoli TaxID=453575 RepID=UPI0010211B65|nr:hypothetical protein [Allopusillimonas ginsengisoli]TEA78256.1 hypothetical protein ERE07_10600 [Allopusillimonas ginsengisoli]
MNSTAKLSNSVDVLLGPGADRDFAPLASAKIRRKVHFAHFIYTVRTGFQQKVAMPLERALLRQWMRQGVGARRIEALGLPRLAVEEFLGADALTLRLNPRELIRITAYDHRRIEKSPTSTVFVWDGNWDRRRGDLRIGTRYRFISEIDQHRDQLENTERYQTLLAELNSGKPFASHNEGILLDTPERIRRYLQIYVNFLDNMAENGFDESRPKDELGVAITRDGHILKINKGLHRLAMAQRLGLSSVPVRVRAIHREWWQAVTCGTTGAEALARVRDALPACTPEKYAGPLDPEPSGDHLPDDFWPAPYGRHATLGQS